MYRSARPQPGTTPPTPDSEPWSQARLAPQSSSANFLSVPCSLLSLADQPTRWYLARLRTAPCTTPQAVTASTSRLSTRTLRLDTLCLYYEYIESLDFQCSGIVDESEKEAQKCFHIPTAATTKQYIWRRYNAVPANLLLATLPSRLELSLMLAYRVLSAHRTGISDL